MAVSQIERLLTVQELDIKIRSMERELRDLPARKALEQSRLEEHRARLTEAEDALKAQQTEIKQLDLENQARVERISKLRTQQLQLKSNKEFQTMESEIATVKGEISQIEDGELAVMERFEAAKAKVATERKALAKEEEAVNADVRVLDERAAHVEADLAHVREQREKAAKEVAPEWKSRYERILTRKANPIAQLRDGICGGCHMKLPPAVAHDTHRRTIMVFCNYCGRMLY